MVTRVVKTRASRKRKLDENRQNYSSKRAKIMMMKKLVADYNKLNKKKSCKANNDYYLLHSFYEEKKVLFPWLKKECFRWHVRQSKGNDTPSDCTDESTCTNTSNTTNTTDAATLSSPSGNKENSGSLINKTQSQVRT